MNFLKSEFQKEGFKNWIIAYLFAILTLLAVQYNYLSELMKWVSFVFMFLGFFNQIEGSKITKPEYHMHVFFDLIFGLGVAFVFFSCNLYPHAVVAIATTMIDVLFTKRQKEKAST